MSHVNVLFDQNDYGKIRQLFSSSALNILLDDVHTGSLMLSGFKQTPRLHS